MEKLKTSLSDDEVRAMFKGRKYVYFTTLKPPRGEDRLDKVILFCTKYLIKRSYEYWIVPSISETGYKHYHGIVSPPCDLELDKLASIKKAYQRKVNRDIGFNYELQAVNDFDAVLRYVNKQRDLGYDINSKVPVEYSSSV